MAARAWRALLFPGLGAPPPSPRARQSPRWEALARRIRPAVAEPAGAPAAWSADAHAMVDRFTASLCLLEGAPGALAGDVIFAAHSVGVYAAAVAAGLWSIEDGARALGLSIAFARDLAPPGALISLLGLPPDAARGLPPGDGAPWALAGELGPEHTLLGGPPAGAEALLRAAREEGALSARRLDAERAYHTAALTPAADALANALEALPMGALRGPLLVGAGRGAPARHPAEAVARQLAQPLSWPAVCQGLGAWEAVEAVEVAEAPFLAKLTRRCLGRGFPVRVIGGPSPLSNPPES